MNVKLEASIFFHVNLKIGASFTRTKEGNGILTTTILRNSEKARTQVQNAVCINRGCVVGNVVSRGYCCINVFDTGEGDGGRDVLAFRIVLNEKKRNDDLDFNNECFYLR